MSQIIIKSEDPIHGHSTKSFNTREEAEAYMDSIGLVKTPTEAVVQAEETPKPAKQPVKKVAKPVAKRKPGKAKKR